MEQASTIGIPLCLRNSLVGRHPRNGLQRNSLIFRGIGSFQSRLHFDLLSREVAFADRLLATW